MAMLVPLSKKVAIAPPCVLFVTRLLLTKSGTASDQVIFALLVSDSLVTDVRVAFLTKLPSMLSIGMESAYAPMYERTLSAAALSASDCIASNGRRRLCRAVRIVSLLCRFQRLSWTYPELKHGISMRLTGCVADAEVRQVVTSLHADRFACLHANDGNSIFEPSLVVGIQARRQCLFDITSTF